MKKVLFISASLFFVLGATTVNAQLANYTVTAPNLTENTSDAGNRSAGVAGVNTTVTDNFSKAFPGVVNVMWTKADKTTWGYFKQHDVQVRVSYNEKGKLLYTIRYYNQHQVSQFVKDAVKREGFSMPIVHVTEVKARYNTINFVKMEDSHSIITLCVKANGDVSVYEELNKG